MGRDFGLGDVDAVGLIAAAAVVIICMAGGSARWMDQCQRYILGTTLTIFTWSYSEVAGRLNSLSQSQRSRSPSSPRLEPWLSNDLFRRACAWAMTRLDLFGGSVFAHDSPAKAVKRPRSVS